LAGKSETLKVAKILISTPVEPNNLAEVTTPLLLSGKALFRKLSFVEGWIHALEWMINDDKLLMKPSKKASSESRGKK